ncbi:MAG: hypothetical protein MJ252_26370, partial [archaeon]|nr:hypothetical protein [archaeon]
KDYKSYSLLFNLLSSFYLKVCSDTETNTIILYLKSECEVLINSTFKECLCLLIILVLSQYKIFLIIYKVLKENLIVYSQRRLYVVNNPHMTFRRDIMTI